MKELLFREESYAIQGAIFDVYREMGCGFLESVYQECLEIELARREIPFVARQSLCLTYKEVPLRQTFQPDLICYEGIIVEIKALTELAGVHRAQVLNYLKASGYRLGLLVNFGASPKASVERLLR